MIDIKRFISRCFGGDAPACVICGAYTHEELCPECRESILESRERHGRRDVKGMTVHYAFTYTNEVRLALAHFKFYGKPWMARVLAKYMEEGFKILEFDIITYVPLHPRRLRARGYNQAELLAKELDSRAQTLLMRTRNTKPQYRLPVNKRESNVAGAFELAEGVDVSGKNILIVDDIVTTGSTLASVAQVLKSAGAHKISAISFASAN